MRANTVSDAAELAEIRARWSDPKYCERTKDETDVHRLFAALDEQVARMRALAARWRNDAACALHTSDDCAHDLDLLASATGGAP